MESDQASYFVGVFLMPEPIDLPLTFGGHPDSAEPGDLDTLFGVHIQTPFEFAEVADWPGVKSLQEERKP